MGLFGNYGPENGQFSSTQKSQTSGKSLEELRQGFKNGTIADNRKKNGDDLKKLLGEFRSMQSDEHEHEEHHDYEDFGDVENYREDIHAVEEGEKYTLSSEENHQIERYLNQDTILDNPDEYDYEPEVEENFEVSTPKEITNFAVSEHKNQEVRNFGTQKNHAETYTEPSTNDLVSDDEQFEDTITSSFAGKFEKFGFGKMEEDDEDDYQQGQDDFSNWGIGVTTPAIDEVEETFDTDSLSMQEEYESEEYYSAPEEYGEEWKEEPTYVEETEEYSVQESETEYAEPTQLEDETIETYDETPEIEEYFEEENEISPVETVEDENIQEAYSFAQTEENIQEHKDTVSSFDANEETTSNEAVDTGVVVEENNQDATSVGVVEETSQMPERTQTFVPQQNVVQTTPAPVPQAPPMQRQPLQTDVVSTVETKSSYADRIAALRGRANQNKTGPNGNSKMSSAMSRIEALRARTNGGKSMPAQGLGAENSPEEGEVIEEIVARIVEEEVDDIEIASGYGVFAGTERDAISDSSMMGDAEILGEVVGKSSKKQGKKTVESEVEKKIDERFTSFEKRLFDKLMNSLGGIESDDVDQSKAKKSGRVVRKLIQDGVETLKDLELEGTVIVFEPFENIPQATWEDVVRRKGHYTYHVTPAPNGGWFIKRAKSANPCAYVEKKDEALKLATAYAKKEKAELKIHNKKGVIEQSMSFGREKITNK